MLARASYISETQSRDSEVKMYELSLNDTESRYANIMFYLKNGYASSHLNHTKKIALRLKAKKYQIVNNVLFRMNYDSLFLRYLEKYEAKRALQELHDGPTSGHYAGDVIAHKILCACYY